MNELLAKLSSYNIFNYLVPGALFSIGSKRLGIFDLTDTDLATNLLTFYILGMIVSRVGSLLIEPALKWTHLVTYAPYTKFILASQKDIKIEVLVEVSNTYRTFSAAFLILLVGYLFSGLPVVPGLEQRWLVVVSLVALGIMFLASYRKQASFVRKRVEAHQEDT